MPICASLRRCSVTTAASAPAARNCRIAISRFASAAAPNPPARPCCHQLSAQSPAPMWAMPIAAAGAAITSTSWAGAVGRCSGNTCRVGACPWPPLGGMSAMVPTACGLRQYWRAAGCLARAFCCVARAGAVVAAAGSAVGSPIGASGFRAKSLAWRPAARSRRCGIPPSPSLARTIWVIRVMCQRSSLMPWLLAAFRFTSARRVHCRPSCRGW